MLALAGYGLGTGPGIHSSYWQQVWRPIAKLDLSDLRTNDQLQIQHTSLRSSPFLEVTPKSREICMNCFLTVGHGSETDLIEAERNHDCDRSIPGRVRPV